MDDFDNVKNWDPELEIEPEELEFLYPLMKLKEEVRRILLKTQFEDKTEFLLKGMIRVKAWRDVKRHNVLNKTQKEFFAQRKCVAESLLMYKKSGITALYALNKKGFGLNNLRQALIECGLTVAKRQGFEARLNEAASLNANRLKLVEKAKTEYQKVLNLHRSK